MIQSVLKTRIFFQIWIQAWPILPISYPWPQRSIFSKWDTRFLDGSKGWGSGIFIQILNLGWPRGANLTIFLSQATVFNIFKLTIFFYPGQQFPIFFTPPRTVFTLYSKNTRPIPETWLDISQLLVKDTHTKFCSPKILFSPSHSTFGTPSIKII